MTMKKIILFILSLHFSFALFSQSSKTIICTSGNLCTLLTNSDRSSTTNLTLQGTIDARDFKTMRDSMPYLAVLDLSGVSIEAYSGYNGTYYSNTFTNFPANEIPIQAFYGSKNIGVGKYSLKTIILPSTITSIGHDAFNTCINLTGIITFPATLLSIGENAFCYTNNISSYSIPASITSIGTHAFAGSSGSININALNNNYSSLDGILFNKNQTTLIQCPILKSGIYTIPNTVNTIGDYAFEKCSLLTSIVCPSILNSIGNSAFSNATNLNSLNLSPSINSIGQYAFNNCSSLTSINIPQFVTTINEGVFYGCNKLEEVTIQSKLTAIGVAAFYECFKLKAITIPQTVTSIGRLAFKACNSLDSINIPDYVTTIGTGAFYDCTGLKAIYASPVFPVDISSSITVFGNVDTVNCILHVGAGSVSEYRAANQWRVFNIIEAEHILYYKVGLSEINQSISVYPNPSKTNFKIKISGEASVLIYSLNGTMLINQQIIDNELISTDNLSTGVYIMKIIHNNSITTQRLIIDKN